MLSEPSSFNAKTSERFCLVSIVGMWPFIQFNGSLLFYLEVYRVYHAQARLKHVNGSVCFHYSKTLFRTNSSWISVDILVKRKQCEQYGPTKNNIKYVRCMCLRTGIQFACICFILLLIRYTIIVYHLRQWIIPNERNHHVLAVLLASAHRTRRRSTHLHVHIYGSICSPVC